MTDADLLSRIERYYDAVPRTAATTEEIGPFTLFLPTGGWSYYARPRLGARGPFSASGVEAVRARQRERGLPEAFEWVAQTTPGLIEPVRASGLTVHEYPLMVLDGALPLSAPAGVRARLLDPGEAGLGRASAVAVVGFASLGTAVGDAGPEARDAAAARASGDDDFLRDRLRRGDTVMAVVEDDEGPLAVGSSQPVGGVTEIVGVATLPVARRRGYGAAVTAVLVQDAHRRGVDVVFLSAGGEDVARVYGRVGFRRVGTACIAEV